MSPLRCLAEMQLFGGCEKAAQLVQVHPVSLPERLYQFFE
jgi:hypothetical protein